MICKTREHLQDLIQNFKKNGSTIGFVPTMGALHKGHLALVEEASKHADICVVSIFVNPKQFNDKNDFDNYPIQLESDLAMLKSQHCDVVFVPSVDEVYAKQEKVASKNYDLAGLDRLFEGQYRPGHFTGVVDVVSILFDLVSPDYAFFGEKDFQQLAIIKHFVSKNQLPIEIISCPTIRETSGLAMSSRNERLTTEQRTEAARIYSILNECNKLSNTQSVEDLKNWVLNQFSNEKHLKIEYFGIVNSLTLQPISFWDEASDIRALIAVHCGSVRLIDNIEMRTFH